MSNDRDHQCWHNDRQRKKTLRIRRKKRVVIKLKVDGRSQRMPGDRERLVRVRSTGAEGLILVEFYIPTEGKP